MAYELAGRGLEALRQVQLPVPYKGIHLECGYRIDLLVERTVIVEVKAVETLTALHQAQLLTYLKLSGHKIGLLMNFNAKTIKQGLQQVVR